MLLCVDVGNTQTVLGVYEYCPEVKGVKRGAESGLVYHFRLATRAEATADEQAMVLSQLLTLRDLPGLDAISAVVISATNPIVGSVMSDMVQRWLNFDPLVVGPGVASGLEIAYDNPREVGADRIADALGVYDLYGGPAIVVDFGTATTFDVVSQQGVYLGGAISPGVMISLDALFRNAAALRRIDLEEPRSVIGKSTAESVQAGSLYGFASMADGMCERIEKEIGECIIVGTGGLCSVIAPHCRKIRFQEPWLTLHGLRLIHELNSPAAN